MGVMCTFPCRMDRCVMLWLVAQSCLTLCNPMDCSPPGSSVHGILQARILEWVAMPSSMGSSQPRDGTSISSISCTSSVCVCVCNYKYQRQETTFPSYPTSTFSVLVKLSWGRKECILLSALGIDNLLTLMDTSKSCVKSSPSTRVLLLWYRPGFFHACLSGQKPESQPLQKSD